MPTIKEECEYFKQEAKNYIYLQKLKPILENELQNLIDSKNLKSPTMKQVIYENARNPYHDKKPSLMTDTDKKIHELVSVESRIWYIDDILDGIENARYRDIIFNVLVLRSNTEKTAFNANMHLSTMYRMMDREIKRSICKYRKTRSFPGVDVI